jgi:hypothetical protein
LRHVIDGFPAMGNGSLGPDPTEGLRERNPDASSGRARSPACRRRRCDHVVKLRWRTSDAPAGGAAPLPRTHEAAACHRSRASYYSCSYDVPWKTSRQRRPERHRSAAATGMSFHFDGGRLRGPAHPELSRRATAGALVVQDATVGLVVGNHRAERATSRSGRDVGRPMVIGMKHGDLRHRSERG